MSKLVRVGILTLCVFLLSLIITMRSIYGEAARSHASVIKFAVDDPLYRDIIETYFLTFGEPSASPCVNEAFDPSCLNVIVADIPNDDSISRFKRNFTAVGNNLIVIDREMLDRLIVLSNYAYKAQMLAFIIDPDGVSEERAFAANILWAQEYTAILRLSSSGGSQLSDQVARVKAGIYGFPSAAHQKMPERVVESFGPNIDKLPMYLTSVSLGFILEHEMGHLRYSLFRRVVDRGISLRSSGLGGITRREEEVVDEQASNRTPGIISNLRKVSPAIQGTGIERSILVTNFLFFWTDAAIDMFGNESDVYAEFSGHPMYVEDFMFEVQRDCVFDSDVYALIPDPTLAIMPGVANARLKPFPVLSGLEYDYLKRRLSLTTSHEHSALRAVALLERIYQSYRNVHPDFDGEILGLLPNVVRSIFNEEVDDEIPFMSKSLSVGIMVEELENRFRADASIERGATCSMDECRLISGNGVRLEILARAGAVHEVSVLLRLPGTLQENLLLDSALSVLSDLSDVPRDTIVNVMHEVRGACPGKFSMLSGSTGPFVVVTALGTDGYLQLRLLNYAFGDEPAATEETVSGRSLVPESADEPSEMLPDPPDLAQVQPQTPLSMGEPAEGPLASRELPSVALEQGAQNFAALGLVNGACRELLEPDVALVEGSMTSVQESAYSSASPDEWEVLYSNEMAALGDRDAAETRPVLCASIERSLFETGFSIGVDSPSFDCRATLTIVERTICEHREIWGRDRVQSKIYFLERGDRGGSARVALLEDQRNWLSERNRCGSDVACLTQFYDERLLSWGKSIQTPQR